MQEDRGTGALDQDGHSVSSKNDASFLSLFAVDDFTTTANLFVTKNQNPAG
jgi:hypothetical protein